MMQRNRDPWKANAKELRKDGESGALPRRVCWGIRLAHMPSGFSWGGPFLASRAFP